MRTLAVPIIVGNLGQIAISFTDTMMVGRLGANELAAAGFSGNLIFLFLLFGIGLLAPGAALISRSHGRGETNEISEILRHTTLLSVAVALLLMTLLWAGLPLLAHMGQSAEVVRLSKTFFAILTASLLPSLVYQAYKQFTDGLGHTRVGMYVALAAVLLNALLNWLFIYGAGPLPAMGVAGSALASLMCRLLMAIAMIYYVHRVAHFKEFRKPYWAEALDRLRFRYLLRIGVPNGLTYVFEVGAFTFSSVMMGWISAEALAAHQIALNLASISFLVTSGIGVAASIRVGFEMGQHRPEAARFAGRTAIAVGAIYMLLSAVAVFATRTWLSEIYTKDAVVISLAATYLGIAACFQFFDGVQAVAVGALRGLQDTRWPSILAFVAYWVVGLPMGYVLAFRRNLQGEGVWWGLFVGLALTALFLTARFEHALRDAKNCPL
jgi:MATE family multidrug resistance protein